MSSTPVLIWNPASRLDPLYGRVKDLPINLQGDSTTVVLNYPAGMVLGEVLAAQGVFGFYAPANSDGTQNAKGILNYKASVLGAAGVAGAITGGAPGVGGEWPGVTTEQAAMYVEGYFDLAKIIALDSAALALLQGVVLSGALGSNESDSFAQTGGSGTFNITIPSVTVNNVVYPAVTVSTNSATITAANFVIAINAALVAAGIPAYVTATGGAMGSAPVVVVWHGAYSNIPIVVTVDNTNMSGGTVVNTRTAGVAAYGVVKFG